MSSPRHHGRLKAQPEPARAGVPPLVSAIMPVRNEAAFIRTSLGSILDQEYPADRLEVIVVDGMSTDETRATIEELLADRYGKGPRVQVIENPARTMSSSVNEALRQVRGEVVLLVGGHCKLNTDYVSRCIDALDRSGAQCVGGVIATIGETTQARAIAAAQSSFFGVGGVTFRIGRSYAGPVDTVAFGAYRRDVFDEIGGFDEDLVRNQDDEFNFRLVQSGGIVRYEPSIRSTYYSRASLRRLWRQYFEYGLFKVRVIQKRGAVPSWRHLVPGVFVLGLIVSVLLSGVFSQPILLLIVLGPYALFLLSATLIAARSRPEVVPLLPACFATLHLAYGLGFLFGVWRWRRYFRTTRIVEM